MDLREDTRLVGPREGVAAVMTICTLRTYLCAYCVQERSLGAVAYFVQGRSL